MSAERPMKPYDRNEWQPGDAAVIGWRSTSGWERATRCIDGWHTETGSIPGHDDVEVARALLVIDPEDREQVERLLGELLSMSFAAHACGSFTCLQQALRAMLAPPKPPKPEEPLGLGAVVVDSDGRRWVRHSNSPGSFPWISEGKGAEGWSLVDAVEVLSQGVTP